MTTHPKREYTPNQAAPMVTFLGVLAREMSDLTIKKALHECADMLESLASQLAAQKSDNAQLQYALEQSEAKWIAAQKREGVPSSSDDNNRARPNKDTPSTHLSSRLKIMRRASVLLRDMAKYGVPKEMRERALNVSKSLDASLYFKRPHTTPSPDQDREVSP